MHLCFLTYSSKYLLITWYHVISTARARSPELYLRGDDECDEHHEGEHEEADVVVPLARVHPALGVRPHVRVVQHDAHDEHHDAPPDTAENICRFLNKKYFNQIKDISIK